MPQPNDDQLSNLEVYGVDIVGQSQADENLLQKVAAGLALQGTLVSKNEEEILCQRFSLITVQENLDLTYPSNKGIYDKTEQFRSQVRESTFKKGIEKFGLHSVARKVVSQEPCHVPQKPQDERKTNLNK